MWTRARDASRGSRLARVFLSSFLPPRRFFLIPPDLRGICGRFDLLPLRHRREAIASPRYIPTRTARTLKTSHLVFIAGNFFTRSEKRYRRLTIGVFLARDDR